MAIRKGTTVVIGNKDCSIESVIKALKQEETFYYSTNKWADVTSSLKLAEEDVKWMRELHTVVINEILKRFLKSFKGKYSEEAKLEMLISALEDEGLAELSNRLTKEFLPKQKFHPRGNTGQQEIGAQLVCPNCQKKVEVVAQIEEEPEPETSDLDPEEAKRRKKNREKKFKEHLRLGLQVVSTLVVAGNFLSKHSSS